MHCNFHLDALARVCTFKMDIGHFSSHLTILTCVWKTRKTTLKQKCTENKLLFFPSSKFSMIFYFKSKNSLYWYGNCQTLILPQGFYSQKSSSFCPSTSEKDILTEVSLLWAGCNFTTTILHQDGKWQWWPFSEFGCHWNCSYEQNLFIFSAWYHELFYIMVHCNDKMIIYLL